MNKYQIANEIKFLDEDFKKSSFSNSTTTNHCVAIAKKGGIIAVRDTKDETKSTLIFDALEWEAFVKGINSGEF